MILTLIKKIINNDDIAIHIYNIYLIKKNYNNGLLNLNNTNLILNRFINDNYYINLIIEKINFKNNIYNIYLIKKILNKNEMIINKIIKKYPLIIKDLDFKYRNNPNIIKDICFYNSYYFKFASNNLKKDVNFIINLLDINIFIYFFIDDNLKKNKDIVKKINNCYPILFDLI